jgi:hypothetical protein
MEERPFVGGNFSDATLVGDTVRRRSGPWTPTVHALLRFLRSEGFDAAPEPIGIDERGREILGYIDGDTHVGWPEPLPGWIYDEDVMVAAIRLLRRYHDISARFIPLAGAVWQLRAPTAHEVICHQDWAPYNAVFSRHEPVAMLDWDMAGPGSRAWDVVRAACVWVPLHPADERFTIETKAERLRTLCDAYGLTQRTGLIDLLRDQLRFSADHAEREARDGHPGWTKLVGWNVPARFRRDATLLEGQRAALERTLI